MAEIVIEDRAISESLRKLRDDVEFNIHQLPAVVETRHLNSKDEISLANNLYSQLKHLRDVENIVGGWEALRLLSEIETNEEIFCRLIMGVDSNPLTWNPFSKD